MIEAIRTRIPLISPHKPHAEPDGRCTLAKTSGMQSADVRALVRLMGELGDLPKDHTVRAPFLMSEICRLIDAQWGIVTLMSDLRPNGKPQLYHSFQGGQLDGNLQSAFLQYVNVQYADDPMIAGMLVDQPQPIVRSRPQVVEDGEWYRSVHFSEFRRKAYLDESIYAFYPLDQSGNAVGMGFTRPLGASRFGARERLMVEMLNDGLAWFYHQFANEGREKAVPRLSPALVRTLTLLLQGASEKQIAARNELSRHTVHDHVKAIYRRWGVNSRAELLATILSSKGPHTQSDRRPPA